MSSAAAPVIVVGAGLSGLTCARALRAAGVPALVLDAADAPGGRVRTDVVDGYKLDRGFQVFLSSYEHAAAELDLPTLRLRPFNAGALVFDGRRLRRLMDPARHPASALRTALSPLATLRDKALVLKLLAELRGQSPDALLAPERDSTTRARLEAFGFSATFIDGFLRPFFAGVFLESELATSRRTFDFTFRAFGKARASLPADGMEAIARQLAAGLDVRPNTRVRRVRADGVTLDDGTALAAQAVVIATEMEGAFALLGQPAPARGWNGTTCLFYAADQCPVGEATLVLDGTNRGPVNNVAPASACQPSYAPPDRALLAATVVGVPAEDDATLDARCRAQLLGWFGAPVKEWRLLKVARVPKALPSQTPADYAAYQSPVAPAGVFVCGDHVLSPSIDRAIKSGRQAAEALLAWRAAR